MERVKDVLGALFVGVLGLGVVFFVGKVILEPMSPICSFLFVVFGTCLAFERGNGFGWLAMIGVALYVASWFVLPPGYVAETWATATRPGPHVFRWNVMPSLALCMFGFLTWGFAVGAERVTQALAIAVTGPLIPLFLPLARAR